MLAAEKVHIPLWMRCLLAYSTKAPNNACFIAPTLNKAKLRDAFRVEAQASMDDIIGSFELFYVRGREGWLGGPRTKAEWGSFCLHGSFSKAIGFSTRAAATEAAKNLMADCAIVKSSGAFTQVERMGKPVDDVSSRIASACEARDIESAIQGAASARAADLLAQPEPPPSPRQRKSRL